MQPGSTGGYAVMGTFLANSWELLAGLPDIGFLIADNFLEALIFVLVLFMFML